MKSTISAAVAVLSSVATAAANQDYYNVPSAPFQLVVRSVNATYNGAVLNACHEGAGFEGLCVTDGIVPVENYNTYNFNTTANDPNYGVLTWEVESNIKLSEALSFPAYAQSGNVQHPQFTPNGDYTVLFFNSDGYLATNGPPQSRRRHNILLADWAICQTDVNDYKYITLNFIAGGPPASNPTCVNAQVQRVFI